MATTNRRARLHYLLTTTLWPARLGTRRQDCPNRGWGRPRNITPIAASWSSSKIVERRVLDGASVDVARVGDHAIGNGEHDGRLVVFGPLAGWVATP